LIVTHSAKIGGRPELRKGSDWEKEKGQETFGWNGRGVNIDQIYGKGTSQKRREGKKKSE